MKLYLAAEMRRADRAAISAGMPEQLLMEAAGRAVADSILRNFPLCRRPLVLCGPGNNGGDGYVAARYLHLAGLQVRILELAPPPVGGAAAVAKTACLTHLVARPLSSRSLAAALDGAAGVAPVGAVENAPVDLVVDALFGSGLSRPLEGDTAALVERLNAARLPIVSVDVPSGIDADTPVPPGPHLRASLTVQLAGAKVASAFDPARAAFGRQELASIGIPAEILSRESSVRVLPDEGGRGIPKRERDAHKYQVGTVLVVAGSPRYLGAAELACRAAYRAGAGLVTLAAAGRLPGSWPEIIFDQIDWGGNAVATLESLDERRAQAIVAGPGLDEGALRYLPGLISRREAPWVLDATALSPSPELRAAVRAHGKCVLTPHAGEAARLLNRASSELRQRPLQSARELAIDWNAICVLKGATTVVATPTGSISVSTAGHAGMATGGTGDVLAGVIGAFLASGGDPLDSTEGAVSVHGRAGELAGAELGNSLLARDLIRCLPHAIAELSGGVPGYQAQHRENPRGDGP